jgi:sporulation protein YlmC with PRC-barrel domain
MKNQIIAALLSVAFVGGAAYAQNAQPSDRAAPTASSAVDSNTKAVLKGSWRATKLIGLNVYNEANEKLGDVNELLVDKGGKVTAVVIGVGGFLGMGEHDIAVSMDKLKFVEEAVRTSSNASAPARETTTGTTAPATKAPSTSRAVSGNDWVPDHAVMSGSKDQLKAMPQFKYSDYN